MSRTFYSQYSLVWVVLFLGVAVLGVPAVQSWAESTAALKPTVSIVSKATDNSLFTVELIKQASYSVGKKEFDLKVNDKGGQPVEGAEIRIVPWMAKHIHGVADTPVINERGKGLYQAQNINFIMKGNWELRIRVIKGPDQDTVVFEVPDVGLNQ